MQSHTEHTAPGCVLEFEAKLRKLQRFSVKYVTTNLCPSFSRAQVLLFLMNKSVLVLWLS